MMISPNLVKKMLLIAMLTLCFPASGAAQEKMIRLMVSQDLADSGFLRHLLPRFSLKHGIRVMIVLQGDAEVSFTNVAGTPVFQGPDELWRMQLISNDNPMVVRFADWLTSEVGRRTILGYKVDGAAPFSIPSEEKVIVTAAVFAGDKREGARLSLQHCGRCHVVSDANRMKAIGSTPSFFVLRTLPDWDQRFQAFYTLNPHPAFTQVKDISLPFAPNLPSPIVPVEITAEDLEAILAYVSGLAPADLGAEIVHQ